MARRVEVEIVGDASSLHRAFTSAGKAGNSFGSTLSKVGKMAGLAAGGAALGGLYATMKVGVGEFTEHAKVAAQTGAVLKSTGGAAHVTQKEIENLSGAIMKKTGVDDEAIQAGENLLLTFTNLRNETGKGNDIFTRTTKIMTDMSVALGQDMKSSAIQLGKALNDPVKGLTALQRVGVAFDTTQKQMIKDLVEGRKAADNIAQVYSGPLSAAQIDTINNMSKEGAGWREIADTLHLKVNPAQAKTMDFFEAGGHTMEAQKLILKELNKEFAGSAEAAGKTLPGQLNILKETFSNLAGELVGKLVPAVQEVVQFITKHWPEIEVVFKKVFEGIGLLWSRVLAPVFDELVDLAGVVVDWVKKHWPEIEVQAKKTFGQVRDIIRDVVVIVRKLWDEFGDNLVSAAKTSWGQIRGQVESALDLIRGIVKIAKGLLTGDFGAVWDGIKTIFTGAWHAIETQFRTAWENLSNLASVGGKLVMAAVNAVWAGIKKGAEALADIGQTVWGYIEKIGDAIGAGASTIAGWGKTIGHGIETAFLGAVHFGQWILERIGAAAISGAETVKGWAGKIGGWLSDAFHAFVRFGEWIGDKIIAGVSFGSDAAKTVGGWAERIGGWLSSAFHGFVRFGEWIGDKITAGVSFGADAAETVGKWAAKIGGWFLTPFKEALHFGKWIGEKIEAGYEAVKGALSDLKNKIVKWLRDLFDWFSPSGLFEDLGKDMMLGLVKGIIEHAKDPLEAVKMLFGLFDKLFPGMDWVRNIAGIGVGLVRSAVGAAVAGVDTASTFGPGGSWEGAWPREKAVYLKAVEIANARWPYAVGGGHNSAFAPSRGAPHWGASGSRVGYCCSGSVSAAFHAGDYLSYPMVSGDFYNWGQPGYGRYLTTFAKPGSDGSGHVFAVLAGAGWGTGGNNDGGPGWYEHDRSYPYRPRHPFGSQSAARAMSSPGIDTGGGSAGRAGRTGDEDAFRGDFLETAMRTGFTGITRLPDGGILFGGRGDSGHVPGFAAGTRFAPGGLALIGERGPELMYVPRGAHITPNDRLAVSRGTPVVVNLNGPLMGTTVPEVAETIRRELNRHRARNAVTP